ncbi:MAG: winged helix-turn-helix domain-containing protein [Microgenomates group bacterium]
MSLFYAPFTDIPKGFRNEMLDDIFKASEKGQSLQVVGPKRFGKSLSFRLIESFQTDIYKERGIKNTSIYLSNLDLLSEKTTNSAVKYLFGRLIGLDPFKDLDGASLTNRLQEYFKKLKSEGKKIIIIIDNFEKLRFFGQKDIFDLLWAIYTNNSQNVSYVFAFDNEIDKTEAISLYGDLGRLISEKVIHFKPFEVHESKWFLDSTCKMAEIEIDSETKKMIIDVSGGYSFCIKRLVEAYSEGLDIDEIIKNPAISPSLNYNFDSLYNDVYKITSNNQKLVDCGVLKSDGKFVCAVFENYIKLKETQKTKQSSDSVGDIDINQNLTASEHKILQILNANLNKICARDEIIEKLWGENALGDISDHALDQIISRLRKKLIGSKANLETLRGRGYRLSIS